MRQSRSRWKAGASVALAAVVCTAYVLALFSKIPRSWSGSWSTALDHPKRWGWDAVEWTLARVVADHPSPITVSTAYLVAWGFIVPWLLMAMMGRGRRYALGWRRPNRLAWRLLAVGYVLATPFLVWMVYSPNFAEQYIGQWRSGAGVFVAVYAVNMFVEHFFFQGVMLAVLRSDRRWPQAVPLARGDGGRTRRTLQWLGLATPCGEARGGHRVTQWFGLADGCVTPIVVSGLLFGAAHIGKDARELILSVPGGMLLGYIAYRTNSWLTPFGLHLATAGSACVLMLLIQPG